MSELPPPSEALRPVSAGGRSRLKFWIIVIAAAAAVGSGLLALSARSTSDVAAGQYAAALEATSTLQGYRMHSEQQSRSLDMTMDLVQSGSNASITIRQDRLISENRLVDGRYYELDDGRWHLKPGPARVLVLPTDLADLTADLRELPASEIERSADAVTFRITCGHDDRDRLNETVKRLCNDRIETTATINLATGYLERIGGVGEFELSPGRFETGEVIVEIEPLEAAEPIEAPASFDTERATCIADQLGTSDYVEMSLLIEDFTTAQNRDLYAACGFTFFPPGTDLDDD